FMLLALAIPAQAGVTPFPAAFRIQDIPVECNLYCVAAGGACCYPVRGAIDLFVRLVRNATRQSPAGIFQRVPGLPTTVVGSEHHNAFLKR
ncbi:hypothetical protein WLY71_15825, partial [Pseudomonas sp. P2663]